MMIYFQQIQHKGQTISEYAYTSLKYSYMTIRYYVVYMYVWIDQMMSDLWNNLDK